MRYFLLLISLFTVMGHRQPSNTSAVERGLMQMSLEWYLSGRIEPSQFTIRYQIGNANSGETRMDLAGDGGYDMVSTVTEGFKELHFSGKVAKKEVRRLARKMIANKIWDVRHTRSHPGMDEPVPSIEVIANGKSASINCWGSELKVTPAFSEVQDYILKLIHRESGDLILESGN